MKSTLPVLCCGPSTPPLPPAEREELAGRFKALADPTRVAIVNRLAGAGEVCVCELVAEFELSQPTISHHLRVLREAGLVDCERRGTWVYYWPLPEALAQLASVLEPGART